MFRLTSSQDPRPEGDAFEDESFSDNHEEDSIQGDEDPDDNYNNTVVFKSRLKLSEPSMHQMPIRKLIEMLEQGAIDVDPPYQRDVVWSDDRMTGLINSIMENCYIPPLIFNVLTRSDEKFVCIDGKQRIISIKKFTDGILPCTDAHETKWYFKDRDGDVGKRRRKLLPTQIQKTFLDKTLTYSEFTNLSRTQEEDLFRRVQLGLSLSLAERLRAETGPWQDFAKSFERDFDEVLNLSSTHRGKGFQNLLVVFAQVLETENKTPGSSSVIQSGAVRLQKFVKDVDALTPSRRSKLTKIFTTFKEIAAQDVSVFRRNGYERSKDFAAVELIAVAILISTCGENMTHGELLRAIRVMRGHVRQKCHDLFANTPTWKVLWEYIQTLRVFPGALSDVEREAMDDKNIIILSDDDDKVIVISDDDFQSGTLGRHSSPSLHRTSAEMGDRNPAKRQRESLIVRLPLKRKLRSGRPAGSTVPRQTISPKVPGTVNANSCRASTHSSTSSGYSTHSEMPSRLAARRRRARISSSSGESTLRNSASPNLVPTARAGTADDRFQTRAPVSQDLGTKDAENSTDIKREPIIFGTVSNTARELAESWRRVKEEREGGDTEYLA